MLSLLYSVVISRHVNSCLFSLFLFLDVFVFYRTGIIIYDFFMGTVLYPRIGEVDIKMIAECRWSWLTLMILTMSCAMKQYENLGYVSREMGVMLVAHWLYSNATVKGEHYIPCTWDMFHEKFGWMLNFWNITGTCLSPHFADP